MFNYNGTSGHATEESTWEFENMIEVAPQSDYQYSASYIVTVVAERRRS